MAIKEIFWDGEDVCVQYAPKKSEYVTAHPYVLHWWRPTIAGLLPRPHWGLVGPLEGMTTAQAIQAVEETGGILTDEA